MRKIINLAWKLFVIALAAGLVLGLVNEITKGPIAEQDAAASDASRFAAFPNAASFQKLETDTPDLTVYSALNGEGELIGYVASASDKGYGGSIEVVVGMNLDGEIVGTVIGANGDFSETAGLGAKVKDASFAEQFLGMKYTGEAVQFSSGGGGFKIPAGSLSVEKVPTSGGGIDAVSGATYSSVAVINAFNVAAGGIYQIIAGGNN